MPDAHDSPPAAPTASRRLADLDPPIPMVILEQGLRIRWLSSAALAKLGVPAAALIGRTWYELFPDAEARRAQHEAMFDGGRDSFELKGVPLRRGDCTRFFSLRLRPMRAPDGSVEAIVGVGEDVTAQIQSEAALRASEERFRAISTHAQDLVAICRADGSIAFVNEAVERLLGRRASERIGASVLEYVHPDDVAAAAALLRRMTEESAAAVPHRCEVRKRHADGGWRWLEVTATNLLSHPAVNGIVLNGRDITERKRAEAELRASEHRFQTALWGARSAYWTIDVTADRADVSPEFFEITGINAADWSGEDPWTSRIHPDDVPQTLARYHAHLDGHADDYEAEYRIRTPRGWVWLHDRGRVAERDEAGRPLLMAGTAIDVSERKSLERELTEIAGRERDRIGRDLHDGLGQGLTGISLLLHAFAKRERAVRPENADEVERIAGLVSEAIADVRLLAQGLSPVAIVGGDLALALRSLTRSAAARSGIRIGLTAQPGAAFGLSEDSANQLYRIAQEAVTNAIRHSAATRIRIALSARDGGVRLTVSDNGRGFTPRAPTAAGLGLRIMAYRARAIGGQMSFAAPRPSGTRLVVRCPCSAPAALDGGHA